MFSRVLLAITLAMSLTAAASAQMPYGQPGQGMQRMQGMRGMPVQTIPFTATGTIEALAPTRVQIVDDAGKRYAAVINRQTVMKTTGEATAESSSSPACAWNSKAKSMARGTCRARSTQ